MKKQVKMHIWLTDEIIQRLRSVKKVTGMSMAEFIRRSLDDAMKRLGL